MSRIEDVKVLKAITDTEQDQLLKVIEKQTLGHFKSLTGANEIPEDLEFIVIDVMVKRYNRLDAEGMASRSIEGMSASFSLNDFDEYDAILDRYFKSENKNVGVKFI